LNLEIIKKKFFEDPSSQYALMPNQPVQSLERMQKGLEKSKIIINKEKLNDSLTSQNINITTSELDKKAELLNDIFSELK
jgi:hypothetical protein